MSLEIDLGPAARTTFHVVTAKRMADVPRVRAVVDAILAELEPPPKAVPRPRAGP